MIFLKAHEKQGSGPTGKHSARLVLLEIYLGDPGVPLLLLLPVLVHTHFSGY
jgi:hypothetical protein